MKVQINLSDDIIIEIDKYAKLIGVSRSALCAIFIGQGVMGYQKSYEMIDNVANKLDIDLSAMINSAKSSM